MNTTKDQILAALHITIALGEAIREATETNQILHGIPSGHLYTAVSGKLDYTTYTSAINTLKNTGLVSEQGHVLRWIAKNK